MKFLDRNQAAYLLAKRLARYRGLRLLVLGVPRGAVLMARTIADRLEDDLDEAEVIEWLRPAATVLTAPTPFSKGRRR